MEIEVQLETEKEIEEKQYNAIIDRYLITLY